MAPQTQKRAQKGNTKQSVLNDNCLLQCSLKRAKRGGVMNAPTTTTTTTTAAAAAAVVVTQSSGKEALELLVMDLDMVLDRFASNNVEQAMKQLKLTQLDFQQCESLLFGDN